MAIISDGGRRRRSRVPIRPCGRAIKGAKRKEAVEGGEGAFAVFRAKGPRTVPSSVLQELITVSRHSAVTRGKLWELIVITGGVIKLS